MRTSSGAKWGLFLLTAVMTFNLIDRQIVGVLAEPIKQDLQLTDTQLGLLTGTFFALFYSVIGLPVAALADRTNRAKLIAATCFVWSVMTGVSSLAMNFTQLALARIGVAIGEAGCVPTAFSLVADYVPPTKRATGLSIIWLAAPLAMIGAIVVGAQLADAYGWRVTMVAAAAPGIALALLAWFTMPEPRTRRPPVAKVSSVEQVFILLKNRAFVLLLMASAVGTIGTYTVATWMPVFFLRVHDWSLSEMGIKLGLGMATGAAIGALVSGLFTDRLASRRASGHLFVPIILGTVSPTILFASLFVSSGILAVTLIGLWQVVNSGTGPGMMASFQAIASERSRAVAFALVTLAGNLLGLGVGPPLAGVISDALAPAYGQLSLRYALLVGVAAVVLSLVLMIVAATVIHKQSARK